QRRAQHRRGDLTALDCEFVHLRRLGRRLRGGRAVDRERQRFNQIGIDSDQFLIAQIERRFLKCFGAARRYDGIFLAIEGGEDVLLQRVAIAAERERLTTGFCTGGLRGGRLGAEPDGQTRMGGGFLGDRRWRIEELGGVQIRNARENVPYRR